MTARRALLAGLIVLFPGLVLGQPPPEPIPNPALPANIPIDQLTDHMGLLNTVLSDVLTTSGGSPLQGDGEALWRGFALILISWTGLRIMFGGASWSTWEIVRLILTITIPLWMLRTYNVDVPGLGMPFPMIIPAGGNFISQTFVEAVPAQMFESFTALIDNISNRLTSIWEDASLWNLIHGGGATLYTLSVTAVILPLFCLLLILIFCFAYAQVLYALVVTNILIYLGPMLIPFFVFQPLAFLFWGWLRSLFVYSLYSAVAGAMLYVWSAIARAYIDTFINATIDFSELGWSAAWFISIVPLAVAAVLCSTKVGEIASSLVSGAGGGGMNVAGMATTGLMVATGGAGKIAAVAGKPK